MNISLAELSKKTKSEILSFYKDLLGHIEEAKNTAQDIQSPKSQEVVEQAKLYSPENLIKELGETKLAIHGYFESTSEKLLTASNIFGQLQEAIKISQNHLQAAYNIQVAASALDQLVKDYEAKKKETEAENQKLDYELGQAIESKKRDWQREIEEYNYATQLKRKREKEQFEEEIAKQNKLMTEREVNIASKETELQRLNTEVAEFKAKLDKAVHQTRQMALAEADHNFKNQLALTTKEKSNEVSLLNLKIQHLEDLTKNQKDEINKLAAEVEKAYGQSQAIALKLVENSGSNRGERETVQPPPLSNSHSLPR